MGKHSSFAKRIIKLCLKSYKNTCINEHYIQVSWGVYGITQRLNLYRCYQINSWCARVMFLLRYVRIEIELVRLDYFYTYRTGLLIFDRMQFSSRKKKKQNTRTRDVKHLPLSFLIVNSAWNRPPQCAARWRERSGESPPQHTIPPFGGQSPAHVTATAVAVTAAATVWRTPKQPFIAVQLAHVVVGIIFEALTPTRSNDGVSFHFYRDSNANWKTYPTRSIRTAHTHKYAHTHRRQIGAGDRIRTSRQVSALGDTISRLFGENRIDVRIRRVRG